MGAYGCVVVALWLSRTSCGSYSLVLRRAFTPSLCVAVLFPPRCWSTTPLLLLPCPSHPSTRACPSAYYVNAYKTTQREQMQCHRYKTNHSTKGRRQSHQDPNARFHYGATAIMYCSGAGRRSPLLEPRSPCWLFRC